MITTLLVALSWLMLSVGTFFVVVGAVGVMRMPDLFTRMHAASLTDTLGSGLILGGLMIQAGLSLVSLKLAAIAAFLLLTGPVAAYAVAHAAQIAAQTASRSSDRRDSDSAEAS